MGEVKHGKQLWCVYNHLPGGHIVAIHFEDLTRKMKDGESTKEVLFTADDQLKAFKRSPQVALKMKGKLTKNEAIVYVGTENLRTKPNAADIVIAWAVQQGVEPILAPADQKGAEPKTYEYDKRITSLEDGQKSMNEKLDRLLAATTKA